MITAFEESLLRAGLGPDAARQKGSMLGRVVDALGGGDIPQVWFVPGRLEVLGKHTDYAGGRSLICSVERGICMAARARNDRLVRITDTGKRQQFRSSLDETPPQHHHWFIYPITALRRLVRNFPLERGVELAFESDLPSASGMSSSSALMTSFFLALASANDLQRTELWQLNIGHCVELADYVAAIENGRCYKALAAERGVGTAGGSEDHTAILCSTPGTLSQYRFRPTCLETSVRLRDDLIFAIAASGIAARKTGEAQSQYNRAALAAARLVEIWTANTGGTEPALGTLLEHGPDAVDELRRMVVGSTDPEFSATELLERLLQFVEETRALVPAAMSQLKDSDLEGFRATAARSQELAERCLRNQIPETIALVRSAAACGAIAASAFGAGFGGSVWALIDRSGAEAFIAAWRAAYAAAHPGAGRRAVFFVTRPGPAALAIAGGAIRVH